jgi:hypothetical protein
MRAIYLVYYIEYSVKKYKQLLFCVIFFIRLMFETERWQSIKSKVPNGRLKNCKLTKWQVDKIASWQNGKLKNYKLMKLQAVIMVSEHNIKLP